MKCTACGYEHKGEWIKNKYTNIIGDEKFVEIYSAHDFEINNPKEYETGDYGYQDYIKVRLYACPKCNTVVMKIED